MNHQELCDAAVKWLKTYRCYVVAKELKTSIQEIPDAIGFNSSYSVLIECKTSHKDFIVDEKKPFRDHGCGLGDYRYYFCEPGIISIDEVKGKWGLIYIYKSGKCKVMKGKPGNSTFSDEYKFDTDKRAEHLFLYSLCRRMSLIEGLEIDGIWKKPIFEKEK